MAILCFAIAVNGNSSLQFNNQCGNASIKFIVYDVKFTYPYE